MPLPTPNKNESKDKFVSRCISFVKGESPDTPNEQAVAMCMAQWRTNQKMENINLKFNVPIQSKGLIDDEFIINGTAINAVTTDNGHKFLEEELRISAETLDGAPLLIDHRNEVEAIKGRVIYSGYNEMGKRVDFRAKVMDEGVKQLIKDGRLQTVSVGAAVREIEEADGELIPRGIMFKELSLVAVPADSGATFGIALRQAYDSNSKIKKEEKMTEETQTEVQEPQESKEEPQVEKPEESEESKETETTEMLKTLTQTVAELSKEVKALKVKEADVDEPKTEPESKPEPEPEKEEDEDEEDEVEEKGSYKISSGFGSIKGGSFTVIR